MKTIDIPESFITYNKGLFKKGSYVILNDQKSVVTKVEKLKNDKFNVHVKKA